MKPMRDGVRSTQLIEQTVEQDGILFHNSNEFALCKCGERKRYALRFIPP